MALDTKVIERVITIDASPETVFRLLTDPVQYVRWKGKLAELEGDLRILRRQRRLGTRRGGLRAK